MRFQGQIKVEFLDARREIASRKHYITGLKITVFLIVTRKRFLWMQEEGFNELLTDIDHIIKYQKHFKHGPQH